MPTRQGLIVAALGALTVVAVHVNAQQTTTPPAPAQTGQPPATPPAPGRGQGRGRPAVFPAQQRPPGDPAVIERGKAAYAVTCSACHGVDLRGGQLGGPNLLRSQLMLNDQHGELLIPVVHNGRPERGMPPMPSMTEDDIKAIAEFIHSVAAMSRGQGAPPGGDAPPPDPVVGDAAAGQAYFAAKCGSCHSPTGDLQGLATRVPDARALQNLWVSGGGGRGGRGRGAGAANAKPVTVAVTLPSGETLEGVLVKFDDFLVTLRQADGTVRSVRRDGDTPKVEIRDPLEPHRKLLTVYTDKDMHDVTAYLVTLK
jgi:cytochrome c oxidase cbb3-type subunit III